MKGLHEQFERLKLDNPIVAGVTKYGGNAEDCAMLLAKANRELVVLLLVWEKNLGARGVEFLHNKGITKENA